MQLSIGNVVSIQQLAGVRAQLAAASFVDGRQSAGWSAARVKANEQALIDLPLEDLTAEVAAKLNGHPVFELAVRPRNIIKCVFSRYRPGMSYGTHVDNAIMDGDRTDVSFTLFLSDLETYDGGELVIESASGEDVIKLPAGSAIIYPSSTLHRVNEVTRGERLALVGWVRSHIRDPAKRELLFDLETAARNIFNAHGKTIEFDLLSKSAANLLRMWLD